MVIFIVLHNNLASLEGSLREANGNFNCSYNDLASLEEVPEVVIGNFYCTHNNLASLEGLPYSKYVYSDFSDKEVNDYLKSKFPQYFI